MAKKKSKKKADVKAKKNRGKSKKKSSGKKSKTKKTAKSKGRKNDAYCIGYNEVYIGIRGIRGAMSST